jgi:acyl-CoA thioesterase FadM
MRLRLRILWLFLSSFWKKPIGLLEESVLNLRVLPNDVDITKISNDRYVALMDLGRIDYAFRVGLRGTMVKKLWGPLVTVHTIRFRYPLKIFQKYQLITRNIWWDDNTFYFKQVFERNGRILATGYVSSTLMNRNGSIPSENILEETGQNVTKPEQPKIIARLRELEKLVHETQRD